MKFLASVLLGVVGLTSCQPRQEKIVNPSDYEIFFSTVSAKSTLGSLNEALIFWENKLNKNPKDYTACEKLAGLHSRMFRLNGKVDELYTSDSLLNIVLKQSGPKHAGTFQSLAANCVARHEFWKAKSYIQQAVSNGENKASSLYLLADVQIELGNVDSADHILSGFKNKNNFAWLIRKAKIHDHHGHLDSAILLMERALDLNKSNEDLYVWALTNLSDMYGHAGRIRDAYNGYLEALRKRPDDDYAMKGIAWIAFSHDKNTGEATRILIQLLNRKQVPDYYLTLAEISDYNGDTLAHKRYTEMFVASTASVRFGNMYNRHLALLCSDELNSPTVSLKRAKEEIAIRPTPESYDLLAWAHYQCGNLDDAVNIVEELVLNKSFEPEALYHSGVILRHKNMQQSSLLLKEARNSEFELGPMKTKLIDDLLH